MGQGTEASGLHTTCLTLMLLSFQGHPGPKGETVRHQLSCLPSEGWGTGLAKGTNRDSRSGCPHGHSPAVYNPRSSHQCREMRLAGGFST